MRWTVWLSRALKSTKPTMLHIDYEPKGTDSTFVACICEEVPRFPEDRAVLAAGVCLTDPVDGKDYLLATRVLRGVARGEPGGRAPAPARVSGDVAETAAVLGSAHLTPPSSEAPPIL